MLKMNSSHNIYYGEKIKLREYLSVGDVKSDWGLSQMLPLHKVHGTWLYEYLDFTNFIDFIESLG